MRAVIEMYMVHYGSTWASHITLKDSHGWSSGGSDV